MKQLISAIAVATTLTLTGCVVVPPHPTGFYWGNYARTAYALKKTPSAETLQAHREQLEEIIDFANRSNGRHKVPPGIYAELGMMLKDQGNNTKAIQFFQLEASTYPESGKLMANLIKKSS